MISLKNATVKSKLMLLAGTFFVGLAIFGAIAYATLDAVKINGDLYKKIALGTKIETDLEPPSMSLLAIRYFVLDMATSTSNEHLQASIDKLRAAEKDLENSQQYYLQTMPEGEMKNLITVKCYETAKQYIDVTEHEFIPLVLAGKSTSKQADELRVTKMIPLFKVQQAAVAEADRLATAENEQLEHTATSTVSARTAVLFGVGLLVLVAVLVLCTIIAKGILHPLTRTMAVLADVAKGDLTRRLDVDTKDEIGQMGTALNQALEKLSVAMQSIGRDSQSLSRSSQELSASSQEVKADAEGASAQLGVVSAAAEQVTSNLNTVATATEEMTSSIKEIAKNASDAASVSSAAVKAVDSANATVSSLGHSSAEIGQVIKVITSIAQQTNLLALNATIEAARAGEAGKGFAVVANEVRELAQETAKATEDISRQIAAIQSDSKGAVEAIGQIGGVIARINDISNTIASAVEEQTATTNEIARNVSEAAKGGQQVAESLTAVAQAARNSTGVAESSNKAAGELSSMAQDLDRLVGEFKYD